MKKFLAIIAAVAVSAGSLWADEGMWLLPLLKKMNSAALSEAGCKLSADDIYNINHSSLKDAIVQFGGGCTGEIISDEGLLVTNHHCGYSSIQMLSSVEHDYLKDGYWAMNRNEELPVKGLTVTFLEAMKDVTDIVTKNDEKALEKAMVKCRKEYPECEVKKVSFYNENVHYLIVTKVFKDIRFVGAPPSSIGKFGADTDNWMWPRHTGDFSMFRVYASKDNKPAEYSEENVPYRADRHLKISLKGVQEGDYTMIMGFPGRTTRFQTSPELKMQIAQNDVAIACRTTRQEVMLEEMLADPKVKIQYASKYSGSTNGWKKWKGMKIAFDKLDIIGRAEKEEQEFAEWVNSDKKGRRQKEYGTVLEDLNKCVDANREGTLDYYLIGESVGRIELALFANTFSRMFNKSLKEGKDTTAALASAAAAVCPNYKDYSVKVDINEAKTLMKFYRDNAKEENYLKFADADFATMDIDSYVDGLFENSAFTSEEKLTEALAEKGADIFSDPAFRLTDALLDAMKAPALASRTCDKELAAARQLYTKGLLEWKKGEPSYPDANFTMRLTYGHVKGYSPKDAVNYRYYTTLDGVMEKEDPDNWEFVVPEKLKQLWKDGDFGDYALADGKMPVAFLSNNDITGGNSGSPIMNANGELIGLAFDGNWESMSSDVMFEPDLQRCINVDIRYVLFIVEKFGGARWLIDEMDIVR